jgi:hypothetical protein
MQEGTMSQELRFARERAAEPRTTTTFPTNWEILSPGRRYPPALEDWLRESRVRLLKRYGGVIGDRRVRVRAGR